MQLNLCLTACLVQRWHTRETDSSSQLCRARWWKQTSESVEQGRGSHEASSTLDLITFDRSFISNPPSSQQPRHSSKDTAQTPPQQRQTGRTLNQYAMQKLSHSKWTDNLQITVHYKKLTTKIQNKNTYPLMMNFKHFLKGKVQPTNTTSPCLPVKGRVPPSSLCSAG